MQYNYPRGKEHGYRFTTASHSVCVLQKNYPIVTDMNPFALGLGSKEAYAKEVRRAARGHAAWVTPRRLHDADSDAATLREGALPSNGLGRSVFLHPRGFEPATVQGSQLSRRGRGRGSAE